MGPLHVSRTTTRDDYETPQELVARLRPCPDVDLCATEANRKCAKYLDEEADALDRVKIWPHGTAAWCNPPFSKKFEFLDIIIDRRNFYHVTYVLLPNNIRETKLWRKLVVPYADEIWNLTPRVNFLLDGQEVKGVGFASCIAVYRARSFDPIGPQMPREAYFSWKNIDRPGNK